MMSGNTKLSGKQVGLIVLAMIVLGVGFYLMRGLEIAQLEELSDEVCACPDLACASDASQRLMAKLSSALEERAVQVKVNRAANKGLDCLANKVLSTLDTLKAKACACEEDSCWRAAAEEFWGKLVPQLKRTKTRSDLDIKRVNKAAEAFGACFGRSPTALAVFKEMQGRYGPKD